MQCHKLMFYQQRSHIPVSRVGETSLLSNTWQVHRFQNVALPRELAILRDYWELGAKQLAMTRGNHTEKPFQSSTEAEQSQKSYLDFPTELYFLPAR